MKLFHYIKVYVPLGCEKSDTILTCLTKSHGGCSVVSGIGTWISPQGDLIREAVNFMLAWSNKPIHRTEVYTLADILLTAGEQSVGVEVDGTFYLIDATTISEVLSW